MSYLLWKMLFCLLMAALIGLIVGWLLRRFGAIKRELELTNEIDVRNERVGALEGQINERDGKIMTLGSDLEHWREKVPGLESTLAERDDQVMSLTMDLDTWKQQVPTLESRLSAADAERTQLSANLATGAKNLQERDTEVKSLRKQLADVAARSIQETETFNSEIADQKQQLLGVRGELESTRTAQEQERAEVVAQKAKVESLRTDFAAAQKTSDELGQASKEREQALAELRQSLKSQEAERLSLAEQVTSLSPVALRVTSQDESIAALNQDLRTRDTTIKHLQDELEAGKQQADELLSSQKSLGLLSGELDGMRNELLAARSTAATATQASGDASAQLQSKLQSTEKEWRSRVRIAESGRQQAQADLYRRQEQIDRLERQLAQTQRDSAQQVASLKAAAESATQTGSGATGAAQGLLGAAALAGATAAAAATGAAGKVAATDERQWKTRLRIEESARRKAEADVQRRSEHVQRLEAQLRQAKAAPAPAKSTPKSTPKPTPKSSTPKSSTPKPAQTPSPARAQLQASNAGTDTRFLTSAPKETDDLQKIRGVGKVLQKTLNSLGIYQYRQVALFTPQDIAWVDDRLKFKGRIERDEWIAQADKLHRAKYGSAPKAD